MSKRRMTNWSVEEIILEWMEESGIIKPVQFTHAKGELFIYTSTPGYLIGKAGCLINKYKEKLMNTFSDLAEVHIVEVIHASPIHLMVEDL